jgi:hypothetical protein
MESLKDLGAVAGIGGIALGVVSAIVTALVRYGRFKILGTKQTYQLLRLILILTFATGIGGLAAYLYGDRQVRNDPPCRVIRVGSSPATTG